MTCKLDGREVWSMNERRIVGNECGGVLMRSRTPFYSCVVEGEAVADNIMVAAKWIFMASVIEDKWDEERR
jgi:hypothetical protein